MQYKKSGFQQKIKGVLKKKTKKDTQKQQQQ